MSGTRSEEKPGPEPHLHGRVGQTQRHLKQTTSSLDTHKQLLLSLLLLLILLIQLHLLLLRLLLLFYRKEVRAVSVPVLPVNTFQIFMAPFSRPVASSSLVLLSLVERRGALVFGGLGPKARPHTGWPQLKLLSSRSVWPC